MRATFLAVGEDLQIRRGDYTENRGAGWDQKKDELMFLVYLQRAISRNRHRCVSAYRHFLSLLERPRNNYEHS